MMYPSRLAEIRSRSQTLAKTPAREHTPDSSQLLLKLIRVACRPFAVSFVIPRFE